MKKVPAKQYMLHYILYNLSKARGYSFVYKHCVSSVNPLAICKQLCSLTFSQQPLSEKDNSKNFTQAPFVASNYPREAVGRG